MHAQHMQEYISLELFSLKDNIKLVKKFKIKDIKLVKTFKTNDIKLVKSV